MATTARLFCAFLLLGYACVHLPMCIFIYIYTLHALSSREYTVPKGLFAVTSGDIQGCSPVLPLIFWVEPPDPTALPWGLGKTLPQGQASHSLESKAQPGEAGLGTGQQSSPPTFLWGRQASGRELPPDPQPRHQGRRRGRLLF